MTHEIVCNHTAGVQDDKMIVWGVGLDGIGSLSLVVVGDLSIEEVLVVETVFFCLYADLVTAILFSPLMFIYTNFDTGSITSSISIYPTSTKPSIKLYMMMV